MMEILCRKNRGKLKSLPFRYKPAAQASEPAFPGKCSLACASGLYLCNFKRRERILFRIHGVAEKDRHDSSGGIVVMSQFRNLRFHRTYPKRRLAVLRASHQRVSVGDQGEHAAARTLSQYELIGLRFQQGSVVLNRSADFKPPLPIVFAAGCRLERVVEILDKETQLGFDLLDQALNPFPFQTLGICDRKLIFLHARSIMLRCSKPFDSFALSNQRLPTCMNSSGRE